MAARAYIGGRDPVAPPTGDRPLSLLGWATGPCRPLGGRQALFFCQGPRCEFEEKKLHLEPVVLWGATEGIFEIFQNGYIFLKFLFFLNIKKKKALALLSTGFGWLSTIRPQKFCSWAESTATAVFAGRVSGLVL